MTHLKARFALTPRGAGRSAPPDEAVPLGAEPRVGRAPLEFHRSVPGYAEGRLRELPDLAERLRVAELWVKEESDRFGLPAYKALGTFWAVRCALAARYGLAQDLPVGMNDLALRAAAEDGLTLLAATDGNHGRAVARAARLLGLAARVFVPDDMVPARREAIESEGAELVVVAGSYDDAVREAAAARGERAILIQDTAWPGYEDVPRWIVEGYSTIFLEAEAQLERAGRLPPTLVLAQIGVGSLAAAAASFYRSREDGGSYRLVGVEPRFAECVLESVARGRLTSVPGPHTSVMAGLNCGTPSSLAWPLLLRGFDAFIAIPDERAFEAMRLLAEAGVTAGESGAAGVAGLLELVAHEEWREGLGLDATARVLAVITEGATDPEAYRRIVGSGARP